MFTIIFKGYYRRQNYILNFVKHSTLLWDSEGSGAIGLMAVLSDSFRENPAWKDCHRIGIVPSGVNVDLGP